MHEANDTALATSARKLVISRSFDAPRERVFRAWTQPDELAAWWAPRGTRAACDLDPRPGGAIRVVLHGGRSEAWHGEVRQISPPGRFVFTSVYENEPALETLVTVTFAERDGRTTVTVEHTYVETDRNLATPAAWGEGLDRLGEHLAS
jgi:uncharacterized protein YndB with AHSA1/START domain